MVSPIRPVLASSEPVVLVGAGPVAASALDWALAGGRHLVAADGGAEPAMARGLSPAAVIGDLDSISRPTRDRLPGHRVHRVTDQDSTDFEKCLARIEAPLIIGLGFLGGRVDHTLAALSCIARERRACLLLGPDSLAFAAPREIRLDLAGGSWLSLFPFARVAGRSEGLRWPIDGIAFHPAGRIGTSNEVTGPVGLAFDGPGMVIILPPEARDAALAALLPAA